MKKRSQIPILLFFPLPLRCCSCEFCSTTSIAALSIMLPKSLLPLRRDPRTFFFLLLRRSCLFGESSAFNGFLLRPSRIIRLLKMTCGEKTCAGDEDRTSNKLKVVSSSSFPAGSLLNSPPLTMQLVLYCCTTAAASPPFGASEEDKRSRTL